MTDGRPSGRGFTLAELLAVMSVSAVLVTVASVSLSSIDDNRIKVATEEIRRDLSYARQRAVATGTTHWVSFDVSADSYSLLEEDSSSPGRAGAGPISSIVDHTNQLALDRFVGVGIESVSFNATTEVGFDWVGRPYAADENPITTQGVVQITGGSSVTVEPVTGYAESP